MQCSTAWSRRASSGPTEVAEKFSAYKGSQQHLCFWEPLPLRTIASPVWCKIGLK